MTSDDAFAQVAEKIQAEGESVCKKSAVQLFDEAKARFSRYPDPTEWINYLEKKLIMATMNELCLNPNKLESTHGDELCAAKGRALAFLMELDQTGKDPNKVQ